MTISTAGTVITGRQINGCLRIEAPRVVIRNSRIACTNFYVVYSPSTRPLADRALLEDVEITCNASNGTGIVGSSIIVRRADIHDCENGAHADRDMRIEESWIHAPYNGGGAHADGIQVSVGVRGLEIVHNRIEIPNGTSALIADVDVHSITLERNWLSGGSYTVYCSLSHVERMDVIGNVWLASERHTGPDDFRYPFAPHIYCDRASRFENNTWSDGVPISR